MARYKCYFVLHGKTRCVDLPRGLSDVRDASGFWVDEDYEWCVASEIKFWVPLHKVEYVEKVVPQ